LLLEYKTGRLSIIIFAQLIILSWNPETASSVRVACVSVKRPGNPRRHSTGKINALTLHVILGLCIHTPMLRECSLKAIKVVHDRIKAIKVAHGRIKAIKVVHG
jgi:hypothetical protein